jgi:type IV secretion system protein VirD4
MFSFISPLAYDTAKILSESLGNYTVQSGSVSQGDKRSTSTQMMGRALMTPDEIMKIPPGNFVVLRSGGTKDKSTPPTQTTLPVYMAVWQLAEGRVAVPKLEIRDVDVLTEEKLIARQQCVVTPDPVEDEPEPQIPKPRKAPAAPPQTAAAPRGFRRKETSEPTR